jgi:hypothetical protein
MAAARGARLGRRGARLPAGREPAPRLDPPRRETSRREGLLRSARSGRRWSDGTVDRRDGPRSDHDVAQRSLLPLTSGRFQQ